MPTSSLYVAREWHTSVNVLPDGLSLSLSLLVLSINWYSTLKMLYSNLNQVYYFLVFLINARKQKASKKLFPTIKSSLLGGEAMGGGRHL